MIGPGKFVEITQYMYTGCLGVVVEEAKNPGTWKVALGDFESYHRVEDLREVPEEEATTKQFADPKRRSLRWQSIGCHVFIWEFPDASGGTQTVVTSAKTIEEALANVKAQAPELYEDCFARNYDNLVQGEVYHFVEGPC